MTDEEMKAMAQIFSRNDQSFEIILFDVIRRLSLYCETKQKNANHEINRCLKNLQSSYCNFMKKACIIYCNRSGQGDKGPGYLIGIAKNQLKDLQDLVKERPKSSESIALDPTLEKESKKRVRVRGDNFCMALANGDLLKPQETMAGRLPTNVHFWYEFGRYFIKDNRILKVRSLATESFTCPKCHAEETYFKWKGPHIGWYCFKCGWLKWRAQDAYMPMAMPQRVPSITKEGRMKKIDEIYNYWQRGVALLKTQNRESEIHHIPWLEEKLAVA